MVKMRTVPGPIGMHGPSTNERPVEVMWRVAHAIAEANESGAPISLSMLIARFEAEKFGSREEVQEGLALLRSGTVPLTVQEGIRVIKAEGLVKEVEEIDLGNGTKEPKLVIPENLRPFIRKAPSYPDRIYYIA